MLLLIIGGIVYYAIGVSGFIYRWTYDFDLRSEHLLLVFICGFTGPISWIMGYFIHGSSSNKVIMKSRK